MSKQELLIEDALQFAKAQGYSIIRRALFDWTTTPVSCNAFGAILVKLGKAEQFKAGFPAEWRKWIVDYLEEDGFWIWKFAHGFDYGNELTITHVKKDGEKKETVEVDKISRYANRLAIRQCKQSF
jgi:hypothetical protein